MGRMIWLHNCQITKTQSAPWFLSLHISMDKKNSAISGLPVKAGDHRSRPGFCLKTGCAFSPSPSGLPNAVKRSR